LSGFALPFVVRNPADNSCHHGAPGEMSKVRRRATAGRSRPRDGRHPSGTVEITGRSG